MSAQVKTPSVPPDPAPLSPASLLAVEGLTVRFGAGRPVVDAVSFTLNRGETLALVGESGSGKSLTALSVLGLLPPGAAVQGGVTLDGVAVPRAGPRTLRRLRGGVAGIVFQEPMTSLNPLHRVGRQVAEAGALHGRKLSREQVIALLAEVGFKNAASRLGAFPHQLSGGQRQRVMIAMALANDPALLIADEPTTALDVTTQAAILALLDREKAARGLALLLVSHDLNLVRRHADRVCVMKAGKIVEHGPVARVFAQPEHPYTRMLLDAEPHGRPAPVAPDAPEILRAEAVHVGFSICRGVLRRKVGEVVAVDGANLAVRRGETLGIVGESGSGKTTLGFALMRLLPASGRIDFEGRDLKAYSTARMCGLRSRMQVVFQDPYGSLSPRLSVGDIVAEGLRVHARGLSARERQAKVMAALSEVGLDPALAERYPHEFSGGQRQRIAIARALVLEPHLLVLDEPTSALDRSVQSQVIELLRKLQTRHSLAYVFISHDLAVVRAMSHRVAVMRAGHIVEEGEADAVFQAPRDPYTAALVAAAAA
ncbi:MAG: ABC transporter ATP-binding protein [Acetobacteraceae bacterium]|nr:ABC transporter ATP-binding protein [Acetobacteraceae bacterium]